MQAPDVLAKFARVADQILDLLHFAWDTEALPLARTKLVIVRIARWTQVERVAFELYLQNERGVKYAPLPQTGGVYCFPAATRGISMQQIAAAVHFVKRENSKNKNRPKNKQLAGIEA